MDRELWDASGFLTGFKPLWEFAKDAGVDVTQRQVKEFLLRQESVQVSKKPRRQKFHDTIWASSPNFQWQIDVMIYNRYAYGGYSAMLNIVDVHSRKAVSIPLKSRQQNNDGDLMKALRDGANKMGVEAPRNINADNEFNSKPFLAWAAKHGVNVYFSDPGSATADISSKNSIVERFNRTLAERIDSYRRNGQRDWPRYLQRIVDRYNNTRHATIKNKPAAIYDGTAPNMQSITYLDSRFKKGDFVRIRLKRRQFAKGTEQNYSNELYEVVKRDEKQTKRWWLRDIATGKLSPRPYQEKEMSRVYSVDEQPEPVRSAVREQAVEDEGRTRANRTERERRQLATSVEVPVSQTRARRAPARYRED